jgi:hypothetical protein
MLANGSFDFITEGKIGGKDTKSIIGAVPRWSKIHESVSNSKAIERYRTNKDFTERLKSIFKVFPWGYRILAYRNSAIELEIRPDEATPTVGQPLTLETLLEFRELIPGLSNVPVSDPKIKKQNKRLFKKHWQHVPKLSVNILNSIMDHDPAAGEEPRSLRDFDENPIIDMIIQAKIDEQTSSAVELEAAYSVLKDSGSLITEEEFYTDGLEASEVEEMINAMILRRRTINML